MHLAYDKKEYNDDDSPAQREETLRDALKAQMSTAELTDIHIENVSDRLKPFTYQYHVRVPGYAQRTGKRIFIQPEFFEHGMPAVFTASDRNGHATLITRGLKMMILRFNCPRASRSTMPMHQPRLRPQTVSNLWESQ